MKFILILLGIIYKLYFALVFFLTLTLTYPYFKFLLKRGSQYEKVFGLFKKVAAFLQWVGLAPLKKLNNPPFPEPPYIVIANHTSHLDIVHMYSIIPSYFLFLGKSEILHWPILRIFFKGMNIPVNRENLRKSTEAKMLASEKLKEGINLAIFPEGGIYGGAPKLNPFKNGAFKLAIEHKATIIPVTFLNNWKRMGDDVFFSENALPGIAKAIIHPPIITSGMNQKDLIPLRKRCADIIEKPLKERYPTKFESK
jgi:1-acyl-sn-glycerol-3-phosphate acyltransferase